LKRRFLIAALAATFAISGCAPTTSSTSVQLPSPGPAVVQSPPALREQWLEMFARGYFPGRSGQVFVVPKDNEFVTYRDPLYRFMHGSPHDYDTHIPLLFHGAAFVTAGVYSQPATQQDIAPTIGEIIGAPWSATYTGRVLTEAMRARTARPRIVTVIVVDAMRADYFDTHAAVLPTLTRLRREGAWFAETRATTVPTVTGVGHANIGTGSDPRMHGITVNQIFNRITGKPQEAYDRLDTRELMTPTLADLWNLATDGHAVIIGQGGAIRATAGLVGHGACLLSARKVFGASYGGADGGWETNPECYTMPPALTRFVGRKVWEAAGGTWLGHDIASASKFRASALFQKYEAEALRAVVEESPAGADEVTDLILVNLKGPDYTAHAYGPDSKELRETLIELDRQMAAYLALIDEKAGPGRSLLVMSADHGTPSEPTRRMYSDEIIAALNKKFDPQGRFIQHYADPANNQLHIDVARLKSLGFSLKDVAQFLETGFFAAAFTEPEVQAAQRRLK
jgi:hypothetical protein